MNLRQKIKELRKKRRDKMTVRELVDYFEEDGIFAILFFITIPTSIPTPPIDGGLSTLPGGAATLLLSFQLILGYEKVYLPESILKKEIDMSFLNSENFKKIDNVIGKFESLTRKRFQWVLHSPRLLALFFIPQAILMLIPIVFTNMLPSMCITFMTFSYLFKDGLMALIFVSLSVVEIIFYLYLFRWLGKALGLKLFKKYLK